MSEFKKRAANQPIIIAGCALAIICVASCAFLMSRTHSRPVLQIYPAGYEVPFYRKQYILRFVPRSWIWFWKVRQALLPKPEKILIQCRFINIEKMDEHMVISQLGPPTYGHDGSYAWVLSQAPSALKTNLLRKLAVSDVFRGDVITSGKIESTMESKGSATPSEPHGSSSIFHFYSLPEIRGDVVDLTAIFTSSESPGDTNRAIPGADSGSEALTTLNFAGRVQMPPKGALLVLSSNRAGDTWHWMGLILSAGKKAN